MLSRENASAKAGWGAAGLLLGETTKQRPATQALSHLKMSAVITAIVMNAAMELEEDAVALNQSIHLVTDLKKARKKVEFRMDLNKAMKAYRGHRVLNI
jgi:hypothetical protein